MGTPNKEQNGAIKEQIFGELSFMKISLVGPSLDKKEQNCIGHPQFYSSIAAMAVILVNLEETKRPLPTLQFGMHLRGYSW